MLQVPDWCDWSGSLHLETARNARSVGPLWPFDTPSVLLVGSAMKTTFPTAQKHEIGQRKSTNRMSCQIDLALRVETWQHNKLCRCKAWIKIWWFPRVLKCLAWSNGVNDVHLCHRQAFWATGFHCFQTGKPWKYRTLTHPHPSCLVGVELPLSPQSLLNQMVPKKTNEIS